MNDFKEVEKALAYRVGYVCGKHNLKIGSIELKKIIKDYKKNHYVKRNKI